MDGSELDEAPQQPSATRRQRLRSFMTSGSSSSGSDNVPGHDDRHRFSRLHLPVPSLFRRLTARGSSNAQPRSHHDTIETEAQDESAAVPRRRRPFSSLGTSENRRFSHIHQETVTTVSDRNTAYIPLNDNDNDNDNDHDTEDLQGPTARAPNRLHRSRRMSWSNQMSNFFANMTTPGNRAARSSHASLHEPRSRLSAHEPIAELHDDHGDEHRDLGFRPPTPAGVRMHGGSQGRLDDGEESEYERGYTPRRRRHRPQPVVGEPHDEDYIQRRIESDRRARRATWGPSNNPYSLRESSVESLDATARPLQPVELPASTPPTWDPRAALPTRMPLLFSRPFSNSSSSALPEPAHMPVPRDARPAQPSTGGSPMMFRPAMALRQLLARRNSSHTDNAPSSTIPLAELSRLLASYAAQSSDRDYNGHQETTVDGGTITIYGIRRVNARTNPDAEEAGLFPPTSLSEAHSEERPPLSRDRPRDRPRGPRRIFNFIGPGLSEIDPLPPEFEETFERLRRTRRPRSMFGSGSLRRNGVVEPDVPNTSAGNSNNSSSSNDNNDADGGSVETRASAAAAAEESGSPSSFSSSPSSSSSAAGGPDSDETWIFYIVSAVLPEGHPLLSAPSLFTDNPTYEDMLFLDSFQQKPVASREDLARARGLYSIHRRSNGDLYATETEEVEDVLELEAEARCLICLGEFGEGEEGRKLRACEHFFHRECIDTWLTEGRNSCPLCRGEGVAKKRSSRHVAAGPSNAEPAAASSDLL